MPPELTPGLRGELIIAESVVCYFGRLLVVAAAAALCDFDAFVFDVPFFKLVEGRLGCCIC